MKPKPPYVPIQKSDLQDEWDRFEQISDAYKTLVEQKKHSGRFSFDFLPETLENPVLEQVCPGVAYLYWEDSNGEEDIERTNRLRENYYVPDHILVTEKERGIEFGRLAYTEKDFLSAQYEPHNPRGPSEIDWNSEEGGEIKKCLFALENKYMEDIQKYLSSIADPEHKKIVLQMTSIL